ncbi:MAG TPA: cytochrome c biogenesis CcdA family protein [Brevibacterium sp.]|nr:cytochrome c biogenesis CcdA family protein [Brevibacterium sp.]
MDIGFVSAFIGGLLALLSPCAALLLPAFFASTVGAGTRLLLHGTVFYGGMLLVLAPLGIGVGALGSLFTAYRTQIVLAAAIILIVLGIVQFLGFGFDPAKLVPGGDSARTRTAQSSGMTKTFLLGATSGVAGMCAGPILGAVLTLAAARGDMVGSAVMLAVYGAGMVVPLLVVAAVWHRLGSGGRALLRGREVPVLGLRLHTISMLTGALMIIVGIVFWATNGLVSVPTLVPTDVLSHLQSSAFLTSTAADVTAVLVLAVVILALWFARERRARRRHDAETVRQEDADHDVQR